MHPQNELVFHKEAAEAFCKPVVPFQSCASSSTFLCGFKGLLPSGGRLCITDWPGGVTTVRTVPFQELGGLTRSYTFDSVTGCTCNRSRTSEILEYRFKKSADVETGFSIADFHSDILDLLFSSPDILP